MCVEKSQFFILTAKSDYDQFLIIVFHECSQIAMNSLAMCIGNIACFYSLIIIDFEL